MKKHLHKLVITLLILFTHYNISAQLFLDFEDVTKGTYATAIKNIDGYDWEFTESLVGSLANDKMDGEKSLRFSGKTDSQFTQISEKENGIGTISFLYKSYPGDNQSEWIVQYTTDDGNTWIQVGNLLDNEKDDENIKIFNADVKSPHNITELELLPCLNKIKIKDYLLTTF